MTEKDGITDEVRKREEEYFRRKDQELIDKMRRAAEAAAALKRLEDKTGVHDPEMLHDLEELGFTPETIVLLPLVPLLQVAWAEAGVSAAERKAIVQLARARGVTDGSSADQQLKAWLERSPTAEEFRKARRLIGAIVQHADEARLDMTADDLLKYCEAIAHASGGLFGIGSVSAEERAAMEQIAAELKKR